MENTKLNNDLINMVSMMTSQDENGFKLNDNGMIEKSMNKLSVSKKDTLSKLLANEKFIKETSECSILFLHELTGNKHHSNAFTGGTLRSIVSSMMTDNYIEMVKISESADNTNELIFRCMVQMLKPVMRTLRDVTMMTDSDMMRVGICNVYTKLHKETGNHTTNIKPVNKKDEETDNIISTTFNYYGLMSSFMKPEYMFPEMISLLDFVSRTDLMLEMVSSNEILAFKILHDLYANNGYYKNVDEHDLSAIEEHAFRLFDYLYSFTVNTIIYPQLKQILSNTTLSPEAIKEKTLAEIDKYAKTKDGVKLMWTTLADVLLYTINALLDLCMVTSFNLTENGGVDVLKTDLINICKLCIQSDEEIDWVSFIDNIVNDYEMNDIFEGMETITPTSKCDSTEEV